MRAYSTLLIFNRICQTFAALSADWRGEVIQLVDLPNEPENTRARASLPPAIPAKLLQFRGAKSLLSVHCSSILRASVTFGARGIGSPFCNLFVGLPSLRCPRLAKRMADKLAGNGAISTNSRAAAPNCAPPLRHATMIARSRSVGAAPVRRTPILSRPTDHFI